ncbi:MAG TPA: galactokinase [Ferruginibacter sp.]|nr:galactokinase [Ferruginibacter sp.]HMP21120.1 galactokinase [Ferruginibacter sp.]
MNQLITAQILSVFGQHFNGTPQLYFSPGRINLIGEHIDYNDGFVLPAAIDKGVYFAVEKNYSNAIDCFAADMNEWLHTDIHHLNKSTGWKNYILSVVNEFVLAGKNIAGFNCVFSGDIPAGSGLSSSAAVECGLAFAINDIFNCGYNTQELALLCQRAEHNFPNVQCGIMDMYASLHGKKDAVLLLDCQTISHQYLPFSQDAYSIVLFNSNVKHSLSGGEYNERRQWCEAGLALLKQHTGIQSFRQEGAAAAVQTCRHLMQSEVYHACLYVTAEIARTQQAAQLLQEQDIAAFGKLLYDTHWGLSLLYKVSCPELDFLVEQAAQIPAVAGARLMGGGFGGCTINIVEKVHVEEVIQTISKAYQLEFGIVTEVYRVQIGDGSIRLG